MYEKFMHELNHCMGNVITFFPNKKNPKNYLIYPAVYKTTLSTLMRKHRFCALFCVRRVKSTLRGIEFCVLVEDFLRQLRYALFSKHPHIFHFRFKSYLLISIYVRQNSYLHHISILHYTNISPSRSIQ